MLKAKPAGYKMIVTGWFYVRFCNESLILPKITYRSIKFLVDVTKGLEVCQSKRIFS